MAPCPVFYIAIIKKILITMMCNHVKFQINSQIYGIFICEEGGTVLSDGINNSTGLWTTH